MADASLSQHQIYTSDDSPHTNITFTLLSSTATGDRALLWICWTNLHSNSVSGLGATWTRILHFDGAIIGNIELWEGVGCTAGNTLISVTNASDVVSAMVQVWANAPDRIAAVMSATEVTSANPITPSVATQAAGQGVAGFWEQFNQSTDYGTYTDTAGAWTVEDGSFRAAEAIRMHSAARVAAEAATQQHQGNGSLSKQWVACAVVLGTAVKPPPPKPIVVAQGAAISRAANW